MEMTEVRMDVVKVAVSLLQPDHEAHPYFAVMVEYRGRDRWAVTRYSECLSRSGEWGHESLPSSRTDEWLAENRFTYNEAIEAASKVAPTIKMNGYTAQDILDGKLEWR